jgi:hypothetical protein
MAREPETPDESISQDPGTPGRPPEDEEPEGTLERPPEREDEEGTDAAGRAPRHRADDR